jgi:hypothetical protein
VIFLLFFAIFFDRAIDKRDKEEYNKTEFLFPNQIKTKKTRIFCVRFKYYDYKNTDISVLSSNT